MGSPGFGPRPGHYSSSTFPGPRPGFPGPRHPSSQAGPLPPQPPSTSAPVPSHLAGPPRPMVPPQRPHVSLGQEPQHEQVRVKLVKSGVSFGTSKRSRTFCRILLKWSVLIFWKKIFELSNRVKFLFGDIIHQLNLSVTTPFRDLRTVRDWSGLVRGSLIPFIRDQIWSDPQ